MKKIVDETNKTQVMSFAQWMWEKGYLTNNAIATDLWDEYNNSTANTEFEPGDVVEIISEDNLKALVLDVIDEDAVSVFDENGCVESYENKNLIYVSHTEIVDHILALLQKDIPIFCEECKHNSDEAPTCKRPKGAVCELDRYYL